MRYRPLFARGSLEGGRPLVLYDEAIGEAVDPAFERMAEIPLAGFFLEFHIEGERASEEKVDLVLEDGRYRGLGVAPVDFPRDGFRKPDERDSAGFRIEIRLDCLKYHLFSHMTP